jgi:uncharacterized membrane protein HdeD (DUF308 family)
MQIGFIPGTRREKIGEVIKRIYRNTAPLLVGEAILFTVAGILMLVRPIEFLSVLTFIIGAALVVFGLYRVSMVFVSNLGFGIGTYDVFFGLVTLILGVVFCVYPHDAAVGLIYVFAVLFLLNALRMLFFAINMLRIGFGYYRVDLVAAGIMVVLSALMLIFPTIAGGFLVVCLAIFLLLYAAIDVYMFLKLLNLHHQIRAGRKKVLKNA